MAKPDDLEAVRAISAALSGFSPEEQERILRWVREKVGLAPAARSSPEIRVAQTPSPVVPARPAEPTGATREPASTRDLKSFVGIKRPKSDVQFGGWRVARAGHVGCRIPAVFRVRKLTFSWVRPLFLASAPVSWRFPTQPVRMDCSHFR